LVLAANMSCIRNWQSPGLTNRNLIEGTREQTDLPSKTKSNSATKNTTKDTGNSRRNLIITQKKAKETLHTKVRFHVSRKIRVEDSSFVSYFRAEVSQSGSFWNSLSLRIMWKARIVKNKNIVQILKCRKIQYETHFLRPQRGSAFPLVLTPYGWDWNFLIFFKIALDVF